MPLAVKWIVSQPVHSPPGGEWHEWGRSVSVSSFQTSTATAQWCQDDTCGLGPWIWTVSSSHFISMCSACPALQAQVAALEHSLEEERERCRTERQRRKELHNSLVVRRQWNKDTSDTHRSSGGLILRVSVFLLRLQELRGNIRVHCRVRPVLPFDHIQSLPSGSRWVITNSMKHHVRAKEKMC